MPAAEFHHPDLSIADVRVIHMITRLKEDPFYRTRSTGKKLILMGVPSQWATSFNALGFEAWRLTLVPASTRDIMASIIDQPIKRESVHAVIYGGNTGYSAWGSMRIMSQSVFALMRDGYFIFSEKRCAQFGRYLESARFFRLPFRWHDMSIWQKPRWRYPIHRNLVEIDA